MPTIRTAKHVTITEAHPYHGYVSDGRPGGNATVEKRFNPDCPLCRAEEASKGKPCAICAEVHPPGMEHEAIACFSKSSPIPKDN